MTLTHLFRILWAQRRLILLAGVAGLLLALLWALTSTRSYTATAQVLVGIRAPDTVGNEQPLAQTQPDYLATQADVIRSERVAAAAADALGIASDPPTFARYRENGAQGDPAAYFAMRLRQGLSVKTSATSRVIAIAFNAPDPRFAAAAANAFAEAYRSVSLDLQIEPARAAAGWYDKTAAELVRKLSLAQELLNKRSAELGLTAADDTLDSDITRLNNLSTQLATAQAAQAVAGAKTGGGATPDALLNPVAQAIQTDIARLEGQRRQLATYAGPNNADYQQIVNQLTALRQQLATQQAAVAQGASAGAAQSASSVRALSGAIAAQKSRVIASRAARGQVAALQQDVDNLKATYEQFVGKRAQVGLLGTGGQTNISILSPAAPPAGPSGLSPLVKLIAGLVVGLGIGTALALAREFLDQRIRGSDDADMWLGISDLGSIRPIRGPAATPLLRAATRYLPSQSEAAAP